jgi:hypothetical protein
MLSGLAGTGLMLAIVAALQSVSGLQVVHVLAQVGRALPGVNSSSSAMAGTAVMLAVGALLGLIYAASQQRIASRGLLCVGLFYGFLIWVLGSVLVGVFYGETLRASLRSWPWLVACLTYGLWLAAVALIIGRRQSPTTVVLKD